MGSIQNEQSEKQMEIEKDDSNGSDDPFADLDIDSNQIFASPKSDPPKDEQKQIEKEHIDEKKEEQPENVIDDPFAPLDATTNVLFENENTSKIEKDESAMDVLGGLLSANPEFESNEEQENVTSTFVDFAKYEEIKDEKIDYDKLTKVSAVDEYKIVSIEETVISEDADGKQTIVKTVDDVKDDDAKQDLEDEKEQRLAHQTIDIDNFMKKNEA